MNIFLFYLIIFYIFVVYYSKTFLPFTFIDELTTIILLAILIFNKKYRYKEFRIFIYLVIFYILYSLFFSVNPNKLAILLDALQQIKPYIFFYSFYLLQYHFTAFQKQILRNFVVMIAFTSFTIGYILNPTFYGGMFDHPASLGQCMLSYALLYYFLSHKTQKDLFICLGILIMGLFSTRSKYYGEFICALFLLFHLKKIIKINFKFICIGFLLIGVILYFTWEKVSIYASGDMDDGIARSILYILTPTIYLDYFPFGSGLASYASWSSGEYYSPIYDKYNISHVYGMTEDSYSFIADTFFPSLAQIGIMGTILFCVFFIKRIKEINNSPYMHLYKAGILIIFFIFIESLASPMFVSDRIFIPIFILGNICQISRVEIKDIN